MAINNGHWNELDEQCKECANLRIFSARMDGNHTYCCGKYPLKENEVCPEFKKEWGGEEG